MPRKPLALGEHGVIRRAPYHRTTKARRGKPALTVDIELRPVGRSYYRLVDVVEVDGGKWEVARSAPWCDRCKDRVLLKDTVERDGARWCKKHKTTQVEQRPVEDAGNLPANLWVARCRYRGFDGAVAQRQAQGATGPEAEANLLAALGTATSSATTQGDHTAQTPMSAVFDQVMADGRLKWKQASIDNYTSVMEHHIRPRFAKVRIGEMTSGAVDRFFKDLLRADLPSVAKQARILMVKASVIVARDVPSVGSFMAGVDPLPPMEPQEPVSLTVDEVRGLRDRLEAYVSYVSPRGGQPRSRDLADVLDVMVCTGCRPGEALALRWQDVNLATSPATLRFTGTVLKNGTRQDSTKTSKKRGATVRKVTRRRRRPSMDPAALKVKPRPIPDWLAARLLELQVNAKPGVEAVFPARNGAWQGTTAFGARWNRATEGTEWAGIERRAMRSTIATHVAEQLGVEVAQRLLDHRKLATTETSYVAKTGVGPDVSAVTSGLFAEKVVAEDAE